MPFKMHKIVFFPENLKKFSVAPVNLGKVGLPKHRYYLFRSENEKCFEILEHLP